MLMRVTPRVKKQENHLEILCGGCAGDNHVFDGATAPPSPALAPPLLLHMHSVNFTLRDSLLSVHVLRYKHYDNPIDAN